MLEIDANLARYYFVPDALGEGTFQVVSFRGLEGISQPFRYEIELVSDDPAVDLAAVVNQPAVLTMLRGMEAVPVYGVVSHLEQASRTHDYFAYRAVLVPRLWTTSLTHQSRIFQHLSVEDIVTEVLEGHGLGAGTDVRFDLEGSYAPREYCVQYRETDFHFVSRLLEHEGLCYFFEHEDRDVFVITDGVHPYVVDGALDVKEGAGLSAGGTEFINELSLQERIVTGATMEKDYNWRTPETAVEGTSQLNGDMPGEFYEFSEHAEDSGQATTLAQVRNEELECQRRIIRGQSDCVGFRAGHKFEITDHYRDDLLEEYLLVRVSVQGSQRQALGLAGVGGNGSPETVYANRFEAIPARIQYRPPRTTPIPQLPGVMTAKVDSAGGDYAYIDEDGSYRAIMPFDRSGTSGGNATLPIRMSQFHSGPDYGAHFPLHQNTEIIWGCIDGDLNRPVALGTVPNPTNTSPVTAENKMQNIIRTASGNQFIMDDTIDEAFIQLNTPDNHRLFLDDENDKIEIESTGKHKVTLDDKNARIEIKTTKGHFVLMQDGKNAKEGKITVQSEAGHRISIDDKEELMTMVDESGDNIFQIDIGNKKLTIKTAEGDIEMLAEQGVIDIKAKTLNLESSGDTSMKAANITSEAGGDHTMSATNITIEAAMELKESGTNVTSEAVAEHVVKGLNATMEASVQASVTSNAMTEVKASGMTVVQGGIVQIN